MAQKSWVMCLALSVFLFLVLPSHGELLLRQADFINSQPGFFSNDYVTTNPPGIEQFSDDFTVPADFQWKLDNFTVFGEVSNGTLLSNFTKATLEIYQNVVATNPEGSPPTIRAPGQTPIFSFTIDLTPENRITTGAEIFDVTFNITAGPAITLLPGDYWFSAYVKSSNVQQNGWLMSARNTSFLPPRGENGRFRDLGDIFGLGFFQQWIQVNGSSIATKCEFFFEIAGTAEPAPTAAPPPDTTAPLAIVTPDNNGAIAGGVVGGVLGVALIVAIVVIVIVFVRRNERNKMTRVDSTIGATGNHQSINVVTHQSNGNVPQPNPQRGTFQPSPYQGLNEVQTKGNAYQAIAQVNGSYAPESSARGSVIQVNKPSSSFEIDMKDLTFDKQIGSGAYGVVFKGTWRGGLVAIKQVLNQLNSSDMAGFKAEAELMANLRPHVNVVQFIGISFGTSEMCIVTEFMDGGSLYDFLVGESKLDANMVQTFARGIAAGMLHLHSENIVHRDLAARNVLLTVSGSVKISDFGMSRVIQTSVQKSNQTKSNTGPLKWMSPESIKRKEYSTFSDIWAYGVTLWEVLCRQEPYPELDAVQAAIEVTSGSLRLTFPDFTPPVLKTVVEICFQNVPEKRKSFKEICEIFAQAPMSDWVPVMKN